MTVIAPDGAVFDLGTKIAVALGSHASLMGTWTVQIVDAGTDGEPGRAHVWIVATHPDTAEEVPLTSQIVYTSPPRPTPNAVAIASINEQTIETIEAYGDVLLEVRSADTTAALQGAMWHELETSPTELGEWTQYRLTSSSGWSWYDPLFEILAVTLRYFATD